jgi:hypothetical protein
LVTLRLCADAGLSTLQLPVEVPVQPVILHAFKQWMFSRGQFPRVESARTRQSFLEITQVLGVNGYTRLNWLECDFLPVEQPAEEPVAPPAEDEGKS